MSRKYLDKQWEISFFKTERVCYVAMTIAHWLQIGHFTVYQFMELNSWKKPAGWGSLRDHVAGRHAESQIDEMLWTHNPLNSTLNMLNMVNTGKYMSEDIECMLYITFCTI
jgi:hypothetical protein